jgi:hypothetical protein
MKTTKKRSTKVDEVELNWKYRDFLLAPRTWPQWPFLPMMNSRLRRAGVLYFCEEVNSYYFASSVTITGVRGIDFERSTPDQVLNDGWTVVFDKQTRRQFQ